MGLHYDEEYFPNPNKFDPEHFNEQNAKNRVPFTFLPFGGGPSTCIGNMVKVYKLLISGGFCRIQIRLLANEDAYNIVEKL